MGVSKRKLLELTKTGAVIFSRSREQFSRGRLFFFF
jgi:hypothetical protein